MISKPYGRIDKVRSTINGAPCMRRMGRLLALIYRGRVERPLCRAHARGRIATGSVESACPSGVSLRTQIRDVAYVTDME